MKTLVIVLALFLTGCTAEYQAMSVAVATQAATAADNSLKAAEWAWCRAPSHGAVMRLYGANRPLWKARLRICWPDLAE